MELFQKITVRGIDFNFFKSYFSIVKCETHYTTDINGTGGGGASRFGGGYINPLNISSSQKKIEDVVLRDENEKEIKFSFVNQTIPFLDGHKLEMVVIEDGNSIYPVFINNLTNNTKEEVQGVIYNRVSSIVALSPLNIKKNKTFKKLQLFFYIFLTASIICFFQIGTGIYDSYLFLYIAISLLVLSVAFKVRSNRLKKKYPYKLISEAIEKIRAIF